MRLPRFTLRRTCFSLFLLLLTGTMTSVFAQTADLTGLWQDDTNAGAIYRVRQLGTRIYWIVDGTSKGSLANLSYGEITGDTIKSIWIDMPGSPSLGGGNLTLRIESKDRLVKISETAPYGAKSWSRIGSSGPTTTGGPSGAAPAPPKAAEPGSIAGRWTSNAGVAYEMTQVGQDCNWWVKSNGEKARCRIDGDRISVQWYTPDAPTTPRGTATGVIKRDADGVAQRIEWNNGLVFMR